MNLLERAKQFKDGAKTILDWLGAGGMCVSQQQAQKRADICISGYNGMPCPFNVDEPIIERTIAAAVKKQVELKNNLALRVVGEKSLHQCRGCGCILRLKVHVPIENLGLEENDLQFYPTFCWMVHEFKAKKS